MPNIDAAQAIGLVALVIGGCNFLNTNDYRFKIQLAVFCVVLSAHFYLMGAITGCIISFISGLRTLISLKNNDYRIMIVFMSIFWLVGLSSIDYGYELLPIIGSSITTYAYFKTSGIKMRFLVGINSLCWLVHNVLISSIGGVIMETTFIIFNLYTISRIYSSNLELEKKLKHHYHQCDQS